MIKVRMFDETLTIEGGVIVAGAAEVRDGINALLRDYVAGGLLGLDIDSRAAQFLIDTFGAVVIEYPENKDPEGTVY